MTSTEFLRQSRDPLFASELYDRMRALIREGLADGEVATRMGCNVRTVVRFRKREGIVATNHGGAHFHRNRRGY